MHIGFQSILEIAQVKVESGLELEQVFASRFENQRVPL